MNRALFALWLSTGALACSSQATDATSTATTTSGASSSSTGSGGSGQGGAAAVCGAAMDAWSALGETDTGRYAAGAAVLDDGSILVAGGWDAAKLAQKGAFVLAPTASAPAAQGALSLARSFVSVSPVPGGLLFAGGFNDSSGSVTQSDLYTFESGAFAPTGKLNLGRELFTTTALPDGRVVAIGGLSAAGLKVRTNAEIYDPQAGHWTASGDLVEPRFGQAAIYVPSVGRILIGGGKTTGPSGDVFRSTLEWFDADLGTFSLAGNLTEARDRPTASLLPDGRVLFVAGANATSQTLTSTEIFDPTTSAISVGPTLGTRRMAHAAVTLGGGAVVVAGGWSDATSPSESTVTAERLDPAMMQWEPLPSMQSARHDLVLLARPDCTIVALGGLHAKQNQPSTTPRAIETLAFAH